MNKIDVIFNHLVQKNLCQICYTHPNIMQQFSYILMQFLKFFHFIRIFLLWILYMDKKLLLINLSILVDYKKDVICYILNNLH